MMIDFLVNFDLIVSHSSIGCYSECYERRHSACGTDCSFLASAVFDGTPLVGSICVPIHARKFGRTMWRSLHHEIAAAATLPRRAWNTDAIEKVCFLVSKTYTIAAAPTTNEALVSCVKRKTSVATTHTDTMVPSSQQERRRRHRNVVFFFPSFTVLLRLVSDAKHPIPGCFGYVSARGTSEQIYISEPWRKTSRTRGQ